VAFCYKSNRTWSAWQQRQQTSGVVDLPIIGKGQLAGAADHSMVAVVPEQQLVGEGDISLRRFVPQRRIKVPTSSISYKKRTR